MVLPQLRDSGIDVNELEGLFALQTDQAKDDARGLAAQIKQSQGPTKMKLL